LVTTCKVMKKDESNLTNNPKNNPKINDEIARGIRCNKSSCHKKRSENQQSITHNGELCRKCEDCCQGEGCLRYDQNCRDLLDPVKAILDQSNKYEVILNGGKIKGAVLPWSGTSNSVCVKPDRVFICKEDSLILWMEADDDDCHNGSRGIELPGNT